MINQIVQLFQGANAAPAFVVVAVSFVLGAVATCLVCRLVRPCGKGKCEPRKSAFERREAPKFEKRHPAPADGSIEIYVGNLSYDLREETLKSAFEKYGKVNAARIITNKFNGKSKGFGFVHMPEVAEAEAAVKALDGKDLAGRPLKCNMARNVY